MKYLLKIYIATFILVSCKPKNFEDNSYPKNQEESISLVDSALIRKVEYLNTVKSQNKYNKYGKREGKWTIYFDGNFSRTEYLKTCEYYRIINYKNGKQIGSITDYYSNGNKQWIGTLTDDTINDIIIGKAKWFDYKGRLTQINHYKNGVKDGVEINYDTLGNITTRLVYPLKQVNFYKVQHVIMKEDHIIRKNVNIVEKKIDAEMNVNAGEVVI